MNSRIGRFYVTSKQIVADVFPAVLARLEFVPLRVKFSHKRLSFEYTGFSPLFDEIKSSTAEPEYTIIFKDSRSAFDLKTCNIEVIKKDG